MFLLKDPCTYLDSLPLSSSSAAAAQKVSGTYEKRTELSGIRVRAEGAAFSQTKVLAETIVPLQRPYYHHHTHRAGRVAQYLSFHQLGSYYVHYPVDSLRSCPTQPVGDSFLSERKAGRGHCSFSEPSPNKATNPYLRLHQPG